MKTVYATTVWVWKFFLEYQLICYQLIFQYTFLGVLPVMIGKENKAIKLLIDKIESNNKIQNCCKKLNLFIIYYLIHQKNLCN